MTAREFKLLNLLHSIGTIVEISPIMVKLHTPNKEGTIEIDIEEVQKFDLYSQVKRGIRENLYQLEDNRSHEVIQFKEEIEKLL